jgi:hypothetical protein
MNPGQSSVWRTCVGLLLGCALAMCQTAFGASTPPREAGLQAPSKDDPDQQTSLPLPEAGTTAYFRYKRDAENMYRIIPADGSQSYQVSASFLQRTLELQADSFQQETILRTYPALMQKMFTELLSQAYPDGTVEYEVLFLSQSFEGTEGTQMFLEQDPAAAPYVRVRRISPEGKQEEFSVARDLVEQLLANEQLTDDQLLQGLQAFPFRLPEAARAADFTHLSAEQLAALVQAEPALRRLGRYSDEAEDRSANTPRQPKEPQAKRPPTPGSRSAEPLGVRPKPAPSPLPSQTLETSTTREEPQPNPGARASDRGARSQQAAKSWERSPLVRTEAASARSTWISLLQQGIQIGAISVFSLGIIALVISRFFYANPTSCSPKRVRQ